MAWSATPWPCSTSSKTRVSDPDAAAALGLLALVAGQDVEQDDGGTWKIAQRVANDRIISTVDPETRHMHKSRSEYRDGYKAHIAIEPETGLVTAATVTPANASDAKTAIGLLDDEWPRPRDPRRRRLWLGRHPGRIARLGRTTSSSSPSP